MNLQELAIKHDYYTSDTNFYSNEATQRFNTWADFYEEYHDADVDMNLVFRWDVKKRDHSNRYYMQIIIIIQRKGIYMPIHIDYVDEQDVPQIELFMKPHFEKLIKNWQPLSKLYDGNR